MILYRYNILEYKTYNLICTNINSFIWFILEIQEENITQIHIQENVVPVAEGTDYVFDLLLSNGHLLKSNHLIIGFLILLCIL